MNYKCSREDFLDSVKYHEMTIIICSDGNRNIRFAEPGTNNRFFQLVTFPGYLVYTGDMGTYVFKRINDMFEFFRSEELFINPNYWGEKLESISLYGGFRKFTHDAFEERVKEEIAAYGYDFKKQDEIYDEVKHDILDSLDGGEEQAYAAIMDYKHDDVSFDDFLDGGGTEEYTSHYIWACYAINWAIRQYDVHCMRSKED